MAVWKLHHHDPYPQDPYLFFVAFADQETVNKLEESHVIHPNLEIVAMPPSAFRSGRNWQKLQQEQPGLAALVEAAPLAVALHGAISRHQSLDYLRDSLEIMTSLVGHGACAVADLVTWSWYDGPSWLARVEQGSLFNPFDHVLVLSNPEPGESGESTSWLRTSGLRKFGRPDLSLRGVPMDQLESARKMLDRFINHLALGGQLEEGRLIQMEGLDGSYHSGAVQGGSEHPEFQNTFVELTRAQS
jgi:hypothetical protein